MLSERRQRVLSMSMELFLKHLRGIVPLGATVRGIRFEPFANTVEILIESEEFSPVAEAAEPLASLGLG